LNNDTLQSVPLYYAQSVTFWIDCIWSHLPWYS